MEINATRNNYITNLTSTYHGVKCRRLATLHQKGLKALPRSIDYDWLQLNQNLYTEAPFHVQIFSLLIFAFLCLQMVRKYGISFSSTTKFRLKLMFCVIFVNVLVWRRFGVPLFPICATLFPIHVPLVPICVTLSTHPISRYFCKIP